MKLNFIPFLFKIRILANISLHILSITDTNNFVYKISLSGRKLYVNNKAYDYFTLPYTLENRKIKYNNKIINYKGGFLVYPGNNEIIVLNLIDESNYLYSVVSSEMPFSEIEALKSQAIVARTYLYRNLKKHIDYDLCDLQHCQVYRGAHYSLQAKKAVLNTEGIIIAYNNKIAETYYHSNSGGFVSSPKAVWHIQSYPPYLKAHPDPYSVNAPNYKWTKIISLHKLTNYLNIPDIDSIVNDTFEHRVRNINVYYSNNYFTISPYRIIKILGIKRFTLLFNIKKKDTLLLFIGFGHGHGVGMSQYGARNMARLNKQFFAILNFYFPDTYLKDILSF